ncbi:MAG: hypothetical protein FWF51_03440 [Chitinivibrionia bacterium]|nr:hypothetical protein [Chitinivibrionia bacterium]
MKKFNFFKYVAVFTAFIALFFAGCGENDDELVDGTDPTNPNGEIVIPNEPPSVSGGELKKTGGITITTEEDLQDFIALVALTLGREYYDNYSSAKRAELPEEYSKSGESASGSFTIRGNVPPGYVEASESVFLQYEGRQKSATGEPEPPIETGYYSGAYKFFDFSNHGELFLGGSVGILEKVFQNDDGAIVATMQANGTLNFAGKYRGKVVFDKVTVTTTYDDNRYNKQSKITEGSFYVQSDNGTPFNLPAELLSNFNPRGNFEYPESKITISMPAVPNVTGGNLQDRDGESVNEENVNSFFVAFMQEFGNIYDDKAPRDALEAKDFWETLEHGKTSGYYTGKADGTEQINNMAHYFSDTKKVEYHDYSDYGDLYFGGGWGSAAFGNYKEDSSEWSRTVETIIKGTVKFNGQFRGELVFNNFRYKNEEGSITDYNDVYTHVSGSVNIGNLDVTQKYLEYVIKGNSIPLL